MTSFDDVDAVAARDAVSTLARGDPEYVRVATEQYYPDVDDDLVHLLDRTETDRDLVAGSRDVYRNTLWQSTNEVMERQTVVATVVLPLIFVVGVFGTNFGATPWNMPELTRPPACPAVVLGMAAVAAILVGYFRRKGWLEGRRSGPARRRADRCDTIRALPGAA